MYALVILTVSGTDTKHLSVVETDGNIKRINLARLAQKGELPNAAFRKVLDESVSQQVEMQCIGSLEPEEANVEKIGFDTREAAVRMGYTFINVKTAVTREGDLREYVNIGDWLDVPGYIGWEDGSKHYTSSIIRAIMRMDAWTTPITVNPLPVEKWPADCNGTTERTDEPVPYKDEQPDSFACLMIKHDEDPGFVVSVTRNLIAFRKDHTGYYKAMANKLPRFKRMLERYQGHGFYYQVITEGSEDRCRRKAREMLMKYQDDIRCLNFESGNW